MKKMSWFVLCLVGALAACDANNTAGDVSRSGAPSTVARVQGQAVGCANGGAEIAYGVDDNANGALDDDEIDGTAVLCNGEDGADGAAGAQGEPGALGAQGLPGASTLLVQTDEPEGEECAAGGTRLDSGVDADGDGELGEGELLDTRYLCNGAAGLPGAQGPEGPEGPQGPAGESPAAEDLAALLALDADLRDALATHLVDQHADALRGAQGAQGLQGPQGEQGPQGPQGAQGPAGESYDPAALEALTARVAALECKLKPRQVFVTSTTVQGNFGGIDAADTLCQNLADAAGLEGNFLAWLSDSTTSPAQRFTREGCGWSLVDGSVIAEDWDDLTDGALSNLISLDERGNSVNFRVWTATGTDGAAFGSFCGDWTVTTSNGFVGSSYEDNGGASPGWWTARGAPACSTSHALYCFEQ